MIFATATCHPVAQLVLSVAWDTSSFRTSKKFDTWVEEPMEKSCHWAAVVVTVSNAWCWVKLVEPTQ